jgi:hypothetical protein
MTREELIFIKVLEGKGYSYKIQGDKIIVTNEGNVNLIPLTSLPPGVEFKNRGNVYLESLTSLPPDVKFSNEGNVYLWHLTSLPPDVEFKNGGYVNLESLIGGRFDDWRGNIKGIDSKRLLNLMIKQGVFER